MINQQWQYEKANICNITTRLGYETLQVQMQLAVWIIFSDRWCEVVMMMPDPSVNLMNESIVHILVLVSHDVKEVGSVKLNLFI